MCPASQKTHCGTEFDLELFLYLVVSLVDSFLSLIILAMLVRSIMSWFMMDGESKIYIFLCTITEPFIYPIRALFERMNWFQGMPIDVSFFCTAILLLLVQTAISFIPWG